ncbi:hypothetical protein BH24ACT4_BH24ACT4_14400 [soil metagenome]
MDADLTSLNESSASSVVQQLLDELAGARDAVERYQRQAVGLRKVIDGLVEMYPAVEDLLPEDLDDDDQPRPRGAEAVRRAMTDSGETWLTVQSVADMLDQRGWSPESSNPVNAVRTALERLVGRGEIEKARSTDGLVIYQRPRPANDMDEEPF